ncbi:MAG: hypothetical protein HQL68_02170 [Magnetococcales bacterium]|nr:hypothetical protein [Magnetococcales bacterium]
MLPLSISKNRWNTIFSLFIGLLFLLSPGKVEGTFDPVNDDTDLFLTNPNITADRPNVLIILDNTANWNQAFDNEKSALVSVVSNLNDIYNVGLMLFPETGGGNVGDDGGYVRFGIRQMTSANKTVLSDVVNGLGKLADKGNNASTALAMYEAYLYYAGLASYGSYGKVKTDYEGNTVNPANVLGNYPLGQSPTSSTLFNSPIANGCQKNFIIYISNGPAEENSSLLSVSQNKLATLTGSSPPNTISITPSHQQGNWADEWAEYMANSDVNSPVEQTQNVYTYTVEVDPGTTGHGPDMTALLKSMANKGQGRYFAVSSGNNGNAIINALNQIFQEVQAVNSVFAATTLPVSVNVRGTNLNQVYVGMFRPDSQKKPRWYGNLKCYQLGLDANTGELYLTDANNIKAENSTTGFVTNDASSFWTSNTSFWNFRPAEDNGSGGESDLPDGDLVEKGGVAQKLRTTYATDQTARKLYTCNGACATGDSLSTYPFTADNSDITTDDLRLDVQEVSSLTGLVTQPVTTLTDIKTVTSISTAGSSVGVSSLQNSAVTQSITSLSSSVSKIITNLSNQATPKTISSITNPSNKIAEISASGHGYSANQMVTISSSDSGCHSDFIGTFPVLSVSDADTFRYTIDGGNKGSCGSGTATTTSTIVTATVASHGFSSGQSVAIAGVTPSNFNGTWTITVNSADSFRFTTYSAFGSPTAGGGGSYGSATGQSTTAVATTSATHGYAIGDSVTIAGATPSGYNGEVTVTAVDGPYTFAYTLDSTLADASGTITSTQGDITVTATTVSAHGYSSGDSVTISGATPIDYNGTYSVNVTSATTFTYDTPTVLAPQSGSGVTASSGVSTTASAVVADHGFASGDWVTISGATPSDYNGSFAITKVDSDTFIYNLSTSPISASGTITARLTSYTAFANLAGHGYVTGDSITISGATPTDYNGIYTITKIDDDNFSYGLLSSPQEAASGSILSGIPSTTAWATAISHGFATGANVTITGASPSAFNGSYTITVTGNDSFYYTLASAQGNGSGTIYAEEVGAGVSISARDDLINWVRGRDNFSDENSNSSSTDIRASVHSDVLHSKPAIVNYNRFSDDHDIMVFYGANDGIFRGVKGGFQSATGEPEPGAEVWGFIPSEFFGQLKRLRNNDPIISSSSKKPYFADGTVSTYILDNNSDGIIKPTNVDGDLVYLFITMRRGGRLLYALDVTSPEDPKFLWKHEGGTGTFAELGYSWSDPNIVTDFTINSGNPVLIIGAGYDPEVEDLSPSTITAVDSTSVTAGGATYTRQMGRGVFALDAATGAILWQAGPPGSDPGTHDHYLSVTGLDYSVPGAITVLKNQGGSHTNRGYFGDTGGNIWRIDMGSSDVDDWTVNKLASISDSDNIPGGLRKFLYPPDVVYGDGYDAVLIGSGDREHPLDVVVENRMYMFKDYATGTTPGVDTLGNALTWPLTEDNLFNATTNCIEFAASCSEVEGDQETAVTLLNNLKGWYIELAAGEKVVGNAITLNNVVFFNTHQPQSVASNASCVSDLGVARAYQVSYQDASSVDDKNIDGDRTAEDRSQIHSGGGFLPPPTPVIVDIDGKTVIGVVSGIMVSSPPGINLGARVRRFWFKEIE